MHIANRITLCALCLAVVGIASAEPYALVLRGLGGAQEIDERFTEWSDRLVTALKDQFALPETRIQALPAPGEQLTRESAAAALEALSTVLQPDDVLMLFIIGHGSQQQEAKLLVEGPDISAGDFGVWLEPVRAARQIVVNAASTSAPFINALTAPGRIICTSTRSTTERNATEFMEHALLVLEEGRGDADRNGELSLLEWVSAAAADTQAWYEREGFIATEHALLEDNADGRGTRLPIDPADPEARDGLMADSVILRNDNAIDGVDPVQLARYNEAIARVRELTAARETMERNAYWEELEARLLEAARLNPALHQEEPPAVD